jgi:peptide/nickel transport system permease protein
MTADVMSLTPQQPEAAQAGRAIPSLGPWRIAWRGLSRNPAAMFGVFGLAMVLLFTALAPWLAPHDPNLLDYDHVLEPPGPMYWWGTDDLGRDILSRVLWGGRESLRVAFLGVGIAAVGGITFGLLSGYYGGWVDEAIQRVVDVLLAFPAILLVLSIVAALGPGLTTILIALGLSLIPSASRLVRGSVLVVRNMDYVAATQALGAGDGRIMVVHILPNIIAPIIVYSTLGLGGAIMLTAGLSYLGLGAQPPSPEWGAMLNAGRPFLRDAWWMSVFPGAAIFVVVLCVNLLGDGLRDALDPKLSR